MVAPVPFTAKLEEPEIEGDRTSGIREGRLPTYNAFSADGDVEAELVYVNYGVPADYKELERLGIDVEEISPEHMDLFGLTESRGVVLTSIDMGRPAARAGLRVGDVVQAINGRTVEDLEEFRDGLDEALEEPQPIEFRVGRGSGSTTVMVIPRG